MPVSSPQVYEHVHMSKDEQNRTRNDVLIVFRYHIFRNFNIFGSFQKDSKKVKMGSKTMWSCKTNTKKSV